MRILLVDDDDACCRFSRRNWRIGDAMFVSRPTVTRRSVSGSD
jgi:hypothetical protein